MGVTDQGLAAIVKTSGNNDVHIILRGANTGPNYSKKFVEPAVAACLKARPYRHPSIMIDCSRTCVNLGRHSIFNSHIRQMATPPKTITINRW
jgi:phospho-2-dehydro-3-deoxyheptonate aldolase